MKRLVTFLTFSFSVLFALSFFTACNGKAPWDYSEVEWYSDDPAIVLRTEYSGEPSIGYIEAEGERTEIYLWWGEPTYTFSVCVYNPAEEISVGTDELLLQGKVTYDNATATLIIEKDEIFGGQYEKIILNRR